MAMRNVKKKRGKETKIFWKSKEIGIQSGLMKNSQNKEQYRAQDRPKRSQKKVGGGSVREGRKVKVQKTKGQVMAKK